MITHAAKATTLNDYFFSVSIPVTAEAPLPMIHEESKPDINSNSYRAYGVLELLRIPDVHEASGPFLHAHLLKETCGTIFNVYNLLIQQCILCHKLERD